MANITLTVKGLTGTLHDIVIDDGETWSNLRTDIHALELNSGGDLTTAMYGQLTLARDPSKNSGGSDTTTFAANGITTGDTIICRPRRNPATNTKEARADQKLAIAEAKRAGLAAGDTNADYYKTLNTVDKTYLPNPYEGNAYNADDDENAGSLIQGRPYLGASISLPQNILDDAFVYLDAGSSASYPGSGNTWSDLSGNGLDATLFGSPDHNNNRAIDLDGGNNYATLPTGFSDDFANGFGLFAIWNFGTAANYERIIDLAQGEADDNIIVGRKASTDTFFYQLYNGSTQGTFVEVDNAIQNSAFASYGVAINGVDGRLYVNGELEGTESPYTEVPTNVSRDSNFIGESNWASDAISSGEAGVVIIFKRALSADEMATLHNLFAPKYGLSQI